MPEAVEDKKNAFYALFKKTPQQGNNHQPYL